MGSGGFEYIISRWFSRGPNPRAKQFGDARKDARSDRKRQRQARKASR